MQRITVSALTAVTLAGCTQAAVTVQVPAPPAMPTACQQRPGSRPVGKLSDVLHTTELLDAAAGGKSIVNEQASQTTRSVVYQSIDNSTRVAVECVWKNMAFVRIVEPSWLTDQQGWVRQDALSQSLDSVASAPAAANTYFVAFDTRDALEGQTVRLDVEREPVCGSGDRSGVQGSGRLTLPGGQIEPVVLIPCGPDTQARRPSGAVLQLRSAL